MGVFKSKCFIILLPWVAKREFLLTMSIQYLEDKWWEHRKTSIWRLLVDPIPNSQTQRHKNCMTDNKEKNQLWGMRTRSQTKSPLWGCPGIIYRIHKYIIYWIIFHVYVYWGWCCLCSFWETLKGFLETFSRRNLNV